MPGLIAAKVLLHRLVLEHRGLPDALELLGALHRLDAVDPVEASMNFAS